MVKTLRFPLYILLPILLLSTVFVQAQAVKVSLGEGNDSGDPITASWNAMQEKYSVVKDMRENGELDVEDFPDIESHFLMLEELVPVAEAAYKNYKSPPAPASFSYADEARDRISQCLDYLDPVYNTYIENLSNSTLSRYGLEKDSNE